MNKAFDIANALNVTDVAARVATVMQVIGGIPPMTNPGVRVEVVAGIGFPALYAPEVNLVALRPEVVFTTRGTPLLAHELCHAQQGLWVGAADTQPGPSGLMRYALCPYERQARRVELTAAVMGRKFLTGSDRGLRRAVMMADVAAGFTELCLIGTAFLAAKTTPKWRRRLLEPIGFWRE